LQLRNKFNFRKTSSSNYWNSRTIKAYLAATIETCPAIRNAYN